MAKVPHLLLAAGESRRMGQPKPLLPWGDKTLIEHQIQIRLQSKQVVIVLLGCHAEKILPVIEKLPVTPLINKEWPNGMGNSIAFGIKMLAQKHPDSEGVLISLVDQPLVTAAHFEKIYSSFQVGNKQIIVSQSAAGWRGVPALFDACYFEDLKKLSGEAGARTLIQSHPNEVKGISCGHLLADIDTPEAYRELLERFSF
jgi:molybdenum cofactor cytidylyltransferase